MLTDVITRTLPNGIVLIAEENPTVHSAAAGIFIQVGSRLETPEVSGASHFVEHMLFKGTSKHSAQELAELFERLGGQNNAFTSKEYTCVHAKTLDEDMEEALELMLEMVFDSRFDEKEFTNEKKVVLEEINMYEDTPDDLVHDVFGQMLYSDFGMGHAILGTIDSVNAITRDSLYEYYKKHYTADNLVIAVSGNVQADRIEKIILENTPAQEKKHLPFAADIRSGYKTFEKRITKPLEQVHICLGVPGFNADNERRHALTLMTQILGGGMSSRLFQNLREKRGLAYSVYAFSSKYQYNGALGFYIGMSPDKIEEFFEAFHHELTEFMEKGISDAELDRTLKMAKSGLYMGMENTQVRMMRLARTYLIFEDYVSEETVVERLRAVAKEDIRSVAESLLSQPFSYCAIGSEAAMEKIDAEFTRWFK